MLGRIDINGEAQPQSEWHRLTLRFVHGEAGAVPVLYRDGRRVTAEWRIHLQGMECKAPARECSANTEGG